MKVFTFWEGKRPKYIDLCLQTWKKNIPDADVHIINYANVLDYIGDIYDIDLLKKFTLPLQSDAISVTLLKKYGGIFLDADTIITKDFLSGLKSFSENQLFMFGNPQKPLVHLALMFCATPNNPLLVEWEKRIAKKTDKHHGILTSIQLLFSKRINVSWNYFGNSIIDELITDKRYSQFLSIIDRTKTGFILESVFECNSNNMKNYINFWFTDKYKAEEILARNTFGVIALHNSWTPKTYKNKQDIQDVLKEPVLISSVLKTILQ